MELCAWHGGDAWMATKSVERERQRVSLVELERVVGLRLDVHADDIEPGALIADRAAARATEQVEETGPISHQRQRWPSP
jgi:hypothetical protein